jgi:hypothetical protein
MLVETLSGDSQRLSKTAKLLDTVIVQLLRVFPPNVVGTTVLYWNPVISTQLHYFHYDIYRHTQKQRLDSDNTAHGLRLHEGILISHKFPHAY